MKFNNIEEIIKEFDLKSSDTKKIKKELQNLLKIVHSGKNSDGQFSDKVSELMYPKIMSALEYIKSEAFPTTRAELTEIVKEIVPKKTDKKKIKKLEKQIKTEIKSFKKASLLPKISASAITIILSFIWFFPSKAIEHPILTNIIKPTDWIFTTIWISSILITGSIWLITRRKEKMIENGIKKLNLESVQNNILMSFFNSKEYRAKKEEKNYIVFTKDEIVNHFSEIDIRKLERVYYFNRKIKDKIKRFLNRTFGLEETIDLEIAQNLAEITTERLLSKNVITQISNGNLSETYKKEIKIEE